MYEDYQYSKSSLKINIKDGKAFVSADVKESMKVQGQVMSGESKEELIIEMINGKALITNVVAYTSI
ncbi:MAG: hypothetical protein ACN4GR_17435 [Arenicellales bacterium]